jgi:acetyl-CoA carboxylase biotin carboxyl carrier protein
MSDQETTQSQNEAPTPQAVKHDRGHRARRRFQNSSGRPGQSINMDELRDLVELIAANGFTDFELEREGFRVRFRRELAPQFIGGSPNGTSPQSEAGSLSTQTTQGLDRSSMMSHPTTPHPGARAEAAASEDEDLHIITSPIVGTFYRSASPTGEPFVKMGSRVSPDTVVCIIEAMKLMNEIQAEDAGEISKIYVENGQPVEYGQPLFGLKK